MNDIYSIGPLTVRLSGAEKMVQLLRGELCLSDADDDVDLEIKIHDHKKSDYKPSHFSGKGSMNFNDNVFFVDYDHFYSYQVENAFGDGPVKLDIFIKRPSVTREAFRLLKSFLSVEYVSRYAFIKSLIASYSCLWSVAAVCLLKYHYSFIHAGILARNNKALVLSGTGGCGKTSTVLHLLSNESFQYLSEDFGIVGSKGAAYRCMKTVSLYHSDIVHKDPSALNAVRSLSFEKKIRWFFLTKMLGINPIIKASPVSLTKLDIPLEPVPIYYGVHLSRQDVDAFQLRKISVDEYSERSSYASGRELKPISELLKLIAANAPVNYNYWDDEKLMSELKNAYNDSFSNSQTFELVIPYRSAPKEVSDFLLGHLDI